MMQEIQVNVIAREVAHVLRKQNSAFCVQVLRFLASGQAVAPSQLAAAFDLSDEQVAKELSQCSSVEYDQSGNVVGMGLTLLPTQHQFEVNGQQLFTWCALDTLSYPMLLQQSARVTSRCPVTGSTIQLTVTPEGVEDVEPGSAVVSLVIPEAEACRCDVRGSFCNYGHFFSSREAASVWQAEHPDAVILSVEEASHVGQTVANSRKV